jgi:tetraacyldisaccharide 4'-kinase
LVVRVRNGLYSAGLFKSHRVNAAVICVGNLTVGGTGKTPLVAWLCQMINQKSKVKNQNCRVAILTRGYKATNQKSKIKNQNYSDEPAELAGACPEVPIIVNPDRVAGARQAISECNAQVLILDDGFQHRRLARDVNIITIDATSPFGYGRLLPAGLLREPIGALRRADAVVITRCDQVSEKQLAQIAGQVRRIHPQAIISTAIHAPINATTFQGTEIGLEELRGKKVYAFCGLGNPEAFLDTIRRIGCILVETRSFDDHCGYTSDCLGRIRQRARERSVDYIVTTQKDWTKIARLTPAENGPPIACLVVELEFVTGAQQLTALIDRVLDGTMPQEPGR